MSPIHLLEFFIFSASIQIFSLFTYLFYFGDLITISFSKSSLNTKYDYIIVGSGTAGSLVAHRIATETNSSFILLEAGGKSHNFHDIPVFGPMLHGSVYDWQYETVPQKHACFAMTDQKCKQTQGKIFGGSAKLNNMIHARGNIYHYMKWFHGKYSKKYIEEQFNFIENNILHLDDIQYRSKFSAAVLDAAMELGYNELAYDNIGFMNATVTQKRGKRWTVSDNVISKHILTNMVVERLIIKNNICFGVIVNGKALYARKGVILSAGTFNSPKILQLSGIGPRDLLESLNVSVLKDLPVGKNLQDHVGTGLDLILYDIPDVVSMWNILSPSSIIEYFFSGTGPLTTPGCEVLGFLSTKNISTPDIQFMVLPVGISADRGSHLRRSLGVTDKSWYEYFTKVFNKNVATMFPLILHPKSKGDIKIQSNNPNIPPLIDPKYLSHDSDITTLKEGLKLIKNHLSTDSMRSIGARLNDLPFPGCEHLKFFSDKYLECYIRHLTLTSYHPVGTCSMGLPQSNTTVTDTSFNVLGVQKLYVVDASVLPTLPSANINAAVALMASIFFDDVIKRDKYIPKSKTCYSTNPFISIANKCSINVGRQ